VDSDKSDSSESEGWIDVESDGDQNLEVSDSEDDTLPNKKNTANATTSPQASEDVTSPPAQRISTLATTKVILDPNRANLYSFRTTDPHACRFCLIE
jgi:protein SDA1